MGSSWHIHLIVYSGHRAVYLGILQSLLFRIFQRVCYIKSVMFTVSRCPSPQTLTMHALNGQWLNNYTNNIINFNYGSGLISFWNGKMKVWDLIPLYAVASKTYLMVTSGWQLKVYFSNCLSILIQRWNRNNLKSNFTTLRWPPNLQAKWCSVAIYFSTDNRRVVPGDE